MLFALGACRSEGDRSEQLTRQKLGVIATIVSEEYRVTSRYPADLGELAGLIKREVDSPDALLNDHNGEQIRYLRSGANGHPVVYSVGRDHVDDSSEGDDVSIDIAE